MFGCKNHGWFWLVGHWWVKNYKNKKQKGERSRWPVPTKSHDITLTIYVTCKMAWPYCLFKTIMEVIVFGFFRLQKTRRWHKWGRYRENEGIAQILKPFRLQNDHLKPVPLLLFFRWNQNSDPPFFLFFDMVWQHKNIYIKEKKIWIVEVVYVFRYEWYKFRHLEPQRNLI